jgi:ComF family protein
MVCKNCENSFIERKHNYIKRFGELTVYSWGLYAGSLRQGILNLKSGRKELVQYFGKKIIEFWDSVPEKINADKIIVTPVPSHYLRVKERGYCQSVLLAKYVSKWLRSEYTDKLITRVKLTKKMNSLNCLEERITNINDAFKANNYTHSKKNILIVDDILTSGSTLREIAKTIKNKYEGLNLIGLTIASGDIY